MCASWSGMVPVQSWVVQERPKGCCVEAGAAPKMPGMDPMTGIVERAAIRSAPYVYFPIDQSTTGTRTKLPAANSSGREFRSYAGLSLRLPPASVPRRRFRSAPAPCLRCNSPLAPPLLKRSPRRLEAKTAGLSVIISHFLAQHDTFRRDYRRHSRSRILHRQNTHRLVASVPGPMSLHPASRHWNGTGP